MKKTTYQPPMVEAMEARVEHGFAGSTPLTSSSHQGFNDPTGHGHEGFNDPTSHGHEGFGGDDLFN